MNLKGIDLNLFLVFNAVYETRNTSRAAELLGTSQPAVSHALGRLRDRLDDPLFKRGRRGVEPTQLADSLAPSVRLALDTLDKSLGLNREFAPAETSRRFRLMLMDVLEPLITPGLFATLATQAPDISIDLIGLEPTTLEHSLKSKEIDVGLYTHPLEAAELRVRHIHEEKVVLIARRDNALIGGLRKLDLETYSKLRFALLEESKARLTHVTQKLSSTGIQRKTVCRVPRVGHLAHIVATSDLVGHVTASYARIFAEKFDLDVFDLPIEVKHQQFYMMWHSDFDRDPGHRWIRELLAEILGDANSDG